MHCVLANYAFLCGRMLMLVIDSEELQYYSWLLQLKEKERKTRLRVLHSIFPNITFCTFMITYVCELLITRKQCK